MSGFVLLALPLLLGAHTCAFKKMTLGLLLLLLLGSAGWLENLLLCAISVVQEHRHQPPCPKLLGVQAPS